MVKCAELLQVKGLCGNETTSIVSKEKDPLANTKAIEDAKVVAESNITNAEVIEADPNESDCCEYNDQMFIKKEISISESLGIFHHLKDFTIISCQLGDVDTEANNEDHSEKSNESTQNKSMGLIRVKRNLFEQEVKKKHKEEASNSLVYNKKSMDIYVKPTSKDSEMDGSSRCSTPLLVENDQEFENIVCSPTLVHHYLTDNNKSSSSQSDHAIIESLEEYDDDDDDDLFIEDANVCTNDTLYNIISQKLEGCGPFSGSNDDSELRRNLLISSVGSLNHQYNMNEESQGENQSANQSNDMKVAIGGLYLRNPRGKKFKKIIEIACGINYF